MDVTTAEDCGQDARDDGRRNSGRRADTGRNAEAEREGGSATRTTMRPAERSRPIVARDQSERRGAKRRARDRMPTVEAAEEGRVMLLSCSFRAQ